MRIVVMVASLMATIESRMGFSSTETLEGLMKARKDARVKIALALVSLASLGALIAIVLATRDRSDAGALAYGHPARSQAGHSAWSQDTSSVNGESCFAPPRISPIRGDAVSLAIGDLNGDGLPDLASTDLETNSVRVSTNNGDGSLRPDAEYRAGKRPDSVAIGDLNGDGEPDLATANAFGTVSVLLKGRTGTFRPKVDYLARGEPSALAIGDLDTDGDPDLLVATGAGGKTSSVLLNRGNGTFGVGPEYRTGRDVVIGDLNGDRKQDLVALSGDRTVEVLLSRGRGSFEDPVGYRTGDGPGSIAIGDLNGDGKLDLATPNFGIEPMGVGNTVSVLFNRGDGTFRHKHDFETAEYPSSVAIGDVNGDGRPDLVTADAETETVSVFPNQGRGSLGAKVDYPKEVKPGGTQSVAIADMNGDGEPDLVANLSSRISVLLNKPGPCTEPGLVYER
jgi:FG-GAP-like repeat